MKNLFDSFLFAGETFNSAEGATALGNSQAKGPQII